jgi:hypothetical protein
MQLSKSLEGFKSDAVAAGKSPHTASRAQYAINHILKFLDDPYYAPGPNPSLADISMQLPISSAVNRPIFS